jgi:predicted secreted protein
MATAAIAGYTAIVKTSTVSGGAETKIGELRDYTLTGTHDTFDATSHDSSGERERIGGITGWTASAEALYLDDAASQRNVFDALNGQTKVSFSFMPFGSSSGDHWTGDGFITGHELTGPNEDAAALAIEMEGTGVLTHTTSTG